MVDAANVDNLIRSPARGATRINSSVVFCGLTVYFVFESSCIKRRAGITRTCSVACRKCRTTASGKSYVREIALFLPPPHIFHRSVATAPKIIHSHGLGRINMYLKLISGGKHSPIRRITSFPNRHATAHIRSTETPYSRISWRPRPCCNIERTRC